MAAFLRSDDPKIFPPSEYKPLIDVTSGPQAPDIELIGGPVSFERQTISYTLGMGAVLLRPLSKGTIELRSSDPFDAPLIDPRYAHTSYLVRLHKFNDR